MNCEKIQDWLMTDYLDGELEGQWREEVEKHLVSCSRCREYEIAIRASAVQPLKGAESLKPPESVWARIEKTIEGEQAQGWWFGLKHSIPRLFAVPRPVFAVAAVVAIVVIAVVFTRFSSDRRADAREYLDQQIQFLSYLDEEDINGSGSDSPYLGTVIEEFFL